MFIAWEQRAMFMDNLDALAWQRTPLDTEKLVPLWEHTFASRFDPIKGESPRKPQ